MNKGILLAIGLSVLSVSGCVTEENYAAGSEALKGSPQLREKAIANCIEQTSRMPRDQKKAVAEWMKVPTDKMTSVFCRRALTAIANGKMSQKDLRSISAGSPTKRAADVIMGRV